MKDKFSKSNFMRISREALEFQLKCLYPLRVGEDPIRVNLIFLNHDRNFSTFLTIRYLAEHGRVADIYSLSRSMFESVISMGLLSKLLIEQDIERYQDFQYIEAYKTYNHLKQLGLEHLSGISPSEHLFICDKQSEYLKKWGRNTMTWAGKSLEQNVKLVDAAYSPTCNEKHFYEYLYCQVYRKGSQLIHSTFGGLSKVIDIERFETAGGVIAQRFRAHDSHLVFSCFHSLLVFLSSVRFLGYLIRKTETEDYFQSIARYIISEG